jgi:SAM-dependent methyltransferase
VTLPAITLAGWLRYDLVSRILQASPRVSSLLEIGPGVGAFGARAAEKYKYLALERSRQSAQHTMAAVQVRRGKVVCGDDSCIKAGTHFDLVCAFEVLEHVEDDVAALSRWARLAGPEGLLLISTPAFQRRFGSWDERAGHFRRYEPGGLVARATAAGLRVIRLWTYGYPLGNALERVRNLIAGRERERDRMEDRTERSGRAFQPASGLNCLMAAASYPWRLLQRPFHGSQRGIGLVMLACAAGANDPGVARGDLPDGLNV